MNKPASANGICAKIAFGVAVVMLFSLAGCSNPPTASPVVASPQANAPIPDDGGSSALTPAGTHVSTPIPPRLQTPTLTNAPLPAAWKEQLSGIKWIAYSPSTGDPNKGIEATSEAIRQDLTLLKQAGFTGLITYSASGVLGKELPQLAQELGFEGLIMGVWDPASQTELETARAAAQNPVVLGYSVGNEGLNKRYELSLLTSVIEDLKQATGKPVATTEEIDDYSDTELMQTGDWVFPNAHPYFHHQIEPDQAVRWTKGAYEDMVRRTDRLVIFKEVGLPTAGDTQGQLSEGSQKQYYLALSQTTVKFVYFEAFDLPWKNALPVEPHWGIFQTDRTPKAFAATLLRVQPRPTRPATESSFYVYRDIDFAGNHFKPSGYMGDMGDITLNEAYTANPHAGKTAIQVVYIAKGRGPNECNYPPPCKWAGVYWQDPPNNWGEDAVWKDGGYNLSDYSQLKFWARADQDTALEFKVGGIIGPYGDSLEYPRGIVAHLTPQWQEFTIDLSEADLSHIVGAFMWAANWENLPPGKDNTRSVTFYLDDIRFERSAGTMPATPTFTRQPPTSTATPVAPRPTRTAGPTSIPKPPTLTVTPRPTRTARPTFTPAPLVSARPIYMGGLASGYSIGVNTSGGITNWLTDLHDGSRRMDYPSGQDWGAVFITVGSAAVRPHSSQDLSHYATLSLELKGEVGGERVWVGVKDADNPDDGSETKIEVPNLTTDWQIFNFPLAQFTTADLTRDYVVTEFVFEPGTPGETVYFRNIQYVAPSP